MASVDRIAAIYLDVLEHRMGLDCRRLEQDLIAVDYGDLTFLIDLYPQDPEFLRIVFRGSMPEELDLDCRQSICTRLTRDAKVVKMTCDGTHLVAAVEMYVAGRDLLPDATHLAAILPRALRGLDAVLNRLGEVVRLEMALTQEP